MKDCTPTITTENTIKTRRKDLNSAILQSAVAIGTTKSERLGAGYFVFHASCCFSVPTLDLKIYRIDIFVGLIVWSGA